MCHLNRKTIRLGISMGLAALLTLFFSQTAYAEGSIDLTDPTNASFDGYRPYLLYDTLGNIGGIPNTTRIRVFAQNGETINMGSSANGLGMGGIRYLSPTGAQNGICAVTGVIGRIQTRAQEIAGPFPLAGGYEPCLVAVADPGVWEVEFISPNPVAGNGNNPQPPIRVAVDNWDIVNVVPPEDPANPDDQPNNVRWIRAWDVTVTDAGDLPIRGRVYADYLPLNMGNNVEGARVFTSIVHIYTEDGYIYEVNMNGMDAFGFQFLSNNKGFRDVTDNPLFRSIQLTGPNNTQEFPIGYDIHQPTLPDTINDQTHKIFFNYPDMATFDALGSAGQPSPSGNIIFQSPPIQPIVPNDIQFTGEEGTPNASGTSPLQSQFDFEVLTPGTYSVTLDINRDNIYGNLNDRIIYGYATAPGFVTYIWDNLDKNGDKVPAGDIPYNVRVITYAGEVHFPFLDPEFNVAGIIIRRVLDPGTTIPAPLAGTVYFDNRYNYDPTQGLPYDYSLCSEDDVPPFQDPPAGSGVSLICHGQATDGREALNGVDSIALGGAHRWIGGDEPGRTAGFGDIRGMDTWSNYPSSALVETDLVLLREADLRVDKSHVAEPILPGGLVTFIVRVDNETGPSDAFNSTFYDDFPPELDVESWTCEGFNGGVCQTAADVDEILEAAPVTIDLPFGSHVVFTFVARVSPAMQPGDTITNFAVVKRPDDVTDPDDVDRQGINSNIDDDIITIDAPTPTPLPTDTPLPTETPLSTDTPLPSPTPTDTLNVTNTPINTPNGSETPSNTPNGSETPTLTPNGSETATPIGFTPPPVSFTPPPGASPSATAGSPDPYINKSVSPPFALPGEDVVWTITITNPDDLPITNVQVIDTLPAELQIISISASDGEVFFYGQTVEFNINPLEAGQTVTIRVVSRVRDSAVPPYIFRNNAVMTGDGIPPKRADASIASVRTLPSTGETPGTRGMFFILILMIGVAIVRGYRRLSKA